MKERLQNDLRVATKSQDVTRRGTLRLCLAALYNEEIARRAELGEDDIVGVLARQAKMRRESIEAFEKGARPDLVAKERAELAVIESYLPPQLGADEIREAARRAIADLGAAGPPDQGRVMRKVMPELRGQVDGKLVAEVVSGLLREGGA